MRFWTRSGYIDLPPVFPPDTAGAGGQLRLSARVEQSPDARTPRRMQRVGRLHWSGAGGSCRVSRPSAGPCGVVVGDPGGNQAAGIGQAAEQRLGKSSRLRPPKLSTKPFRIDLLGAMSCHSALCSAHDWRTAFEVSALPSEVLQQGLPITNPLKRVNGEVERRTRRIKGCLCRGTRLARRPSSS